ncbi:hypothetical protein LSH36_338g04051, partial [Paralvinella palmiformis]
MAAAVAADSPLVVKRHQSTNNNQQETKELKRLIKIINGTDHDHKSAEAQPSENASKTVVTDVSCNYCNEEAEKIEQFCLSHESERQFSKHKQAKLFTALFEAILKNRINNSWLMGKTPSENVFRIIQLVRILLRDAKYQQYL